MNRIKSKRTTIVAAILIMLVGYCFCMMSFTTNGNIGIQKKETINGKYYIYANDIQLECTKVEYNNVTFGDNLTYKMQYKTSLFVPDKGKLIYIKL